MQRKLVAAAAQLIDERDGQMDAIPLHRPRRILSEMSGLTSIAAMWLLIIITMAACYYNKLIHICHQCTDTVGLASGRASNLLMRLSV